MVKSIGHIKLYSIFQVNDDKDKGNSPFDHTNGMKKPDDPNSVQLVNGIDDDKSFK